MQLVHNDGHSSSDRRLECISRFLGLHLPLSGTSYRESQKAQPVRIDAIYAVPPSVTFLHHRNRHLSSSDLVRPNLSRTFSYHYDPSLPAGQSVRPGREDSNITPKTGYTSPRVEEDLSLHHITSTNMRIFTKNLTIIFLPPYLTPKPILLHHNHPTSHISARSGSI